MHCEFIVSDEMPTSLLSFRFVLHYECVGPYCVGCVSSLGDEGAGTDSGRGGAAQQGEGHAYDHDGGDGAGEGGARAESFREPSSGVTSIHVSSEVFGEGERGVAASDGGHGAGEVRTGHQIGCH